jgi:fibronectin type 3 domain-containing protein
MDWTTNPAKDDTAIASYNVTRSVNGGPAVLLGSVGPTVTTFRDKTVNAGYTYTYQVIAVDTSGNQSVNASGKPSGPTASKLVTCNPIFTFYCQ